MTQFYMIKDKKVYSGEYVEDFNSLTVYAGGESKSSQLNGMRIESLAKMLLSHLIREGHAKPEQVIPVLVIDGLMVLQVTETDVDGSVTVTFLVSGPAGILGTFNSRGEAEAYIEQLLSEVKEPEPEPPRPRSSRMGM